LNYEKNHISIFDIIPRNLQGLSCLFIEDHATTIFI
jgi:hypothetical protein